MADFRIVESKLYENVHRLIDDIDVLFLDMECDGAPLTWLYGPLLTKELHEIKIIQEGFQVVILKKA